MKPLIEVELRRMLARRAVRLTAVVLIALIAFGAGMAALASGRDPGPAREERRIERAQELRNCTDGRLPPPEHRGHDFDPATFCDPEYTPEKAAAEVDHRFALRDLPWMLMSVGMIVAVLSLVLGASFIGADWANRTVTTALTWEPRRRRMWIAKGVACAAVITAGALLIEAVFIGAFALVGVFRGTTEGVDGAWMWSIAGQAARTAAMGGIAALIGFAAAGAGRNTAAALGGAFVYLAFVENALRQWKPQWRRWFLGDNAGVFIPWEQADYAPGRSPVEAMLIIALYGALVFAAGLAVFRRRDVA